MAQPKSRNSWLLILPILVGAFLGWTFYRGREAPVPTFFDRGMTYDLALDRMDESGTPILAFITADWCGPCQMLKRGALTDPQVVALASEKTTPVYIDATDTGDPMVQRELERFDVRSFPTLVFRNRHGGVARISGVVGASDLQRWLEEQILLAE